MVRCTNKTQVQANHKYKQLLEKMDAAETVSALVIISTLTLLLLGVIIRKRSQLKRQHYLEQERELERNLPPGPRLWQLAASFFLEQRTVGTSPHKYLASLAEKYGPVMTVPLGAMTTVVISSAEAAREMFKQHDVALSDRMVFESMKLSSGNEGTVITAQMGPTWRMLRRLWASHFFTTARLDALEAVRRRCIDNLVRAVEETGKHGTCPVDLRRLLFSMAFSHLGQIVLSTDLLEPNLEEGAKFYHHSRKIMKLVGRPNVADFVPLLRRWDPQRIRTKMDFHVWAGLRIMAGFVEERRRRIKEGVYDRDASNKDFLDVLLEFRGDGEEEPTELPVQYIINVILEVFMAGSDTSSNTMEWAMAELLRNPSIMSKVQAELRQHIDAANVGEVKDKDFANLPYLNAVVKETLRLHPPLPLLVPRRARKSASSMLGYRIPKGTQILINVWKMGRDGDTWTDPTAFRPERFLEEKKLVDFKGHHFEFIPFGSGRRICPAIPLMTRMLPLVLGTLLYSFDWALPDGVSPESMDMGEDTGIAAQKAVPLTAIAVPSKKSYT